MAFEQIRRLFVDGNGEPEVPTAVIITIDLDTIDGQSLMYESLF